MNLWLLHNLYAFLIMQLHRIHPFREDRRSKSIEEREEEYQRVRDRIFAQDVSETINLFVNGVDINQSREV